MRLSLSPACGLRRLVLALGLLLLAAAASGSASAEEPQGSAVERLKPEEIGFLKKKFPEWEKVEPRRKEHIARNVIRLREMSAADREKLQARIERLHRGRKGRAGSSYRGHGMFRVADEVGGRLLPRLSAAVRVEVGKLDVRPSMVKTTLFRMLKSKAAEAMSSDVSEEDLAALPERVRVYVAKMMADAKADASQNPKRLEALRSRIQRMRIWRRMERLQDKLSKASGQERVPTAEFADALMQEWSGAVEQLVHEISASPKRFLSSVERTERDHMTRTDYIKSVWALERLAMYRWRRDEAAREAADLVVRRLLVDQLRVAPKDVEALPDYAEGRDRRKALEKLIETGAGKAKGAGRSRPNGTAGGRHGHAWGSHRGGGKSDGNRSRGAPGGRRRGRPAGAPEGDEDGAGRRSPRKSDGRK